ncbi:hypothetical protein AAG747_26965 [Rapidithrix thailandica]|uniref:Uncharacterized protein n=1 Tax=Rapidithrix thailandica TaxID=413964 RepID=A0AAW9SID4_9BACT
MKENIHLKELWNRQQTAIPDAKGILKKAQSFQKKHLRKIIFANAALLLTSAFLIYVWNYFQPELLSSKIGIMLMVSSMLLFLTVYNQWIPLLLSNYSEINSHVYLQKMLKLKKKQAFLHRQMTSLYFMLLSSGILLYMYEYTSLMSLSAVITAYGMTVFWLALNWFYFRPKIIKKQEAHINELIDKLQEIQKQFD